MLKEHSHKTKKIHLNVTMLLGKAKFLKFSQQISSESDKKENKLIERCSSEIKQKEEREGYGKEVHTDIVFRSNCLSKF